MNEQSAFTLNGKPYYFSKLGENYASVRKQLPLILGNQAMNFFKDSFRIQGFKDKGLKKWAERKKADGGRYAKYAGKRAILVQTGRLRNSIRLGSRSFELTEVGTDVPYASVHNWGFTGRVSVKSHIRRRMGSADVKYSSLKTGRTGSKSVRYQTGSANVRSHTRQMNIPQRQFIGNSAILEQQLLQSIDKELARI